VSAGFGFSDKPQPDYGFDYTLDEYTSSLESLINAVAPDKLSIVVQVLVISHPGYAYYESLGSLFICKHTTCRGTLLQL
jgi:hypothetical protein